MLRRCGVQGTRIQTDDCLALFLTKNPLPEERVMAAGLPVQIEYSIKNGAVEIRVLNETFACCHDFVEAAHGTLVQVGVSQRSCRA